MLHQTINLIICFILGFAVILRVAWEANKRERDYIADYKKFQREVNDTIEGTAYIMDYYIEKITGRSAG